MMRILPRALSLSSMALIALALGSQASAQSFVTGGQTNVALNFDALSSAAGLTFSSVSGDVIAPGSIADSVAFSVNPRDAASLPTTFSYDAATFPAAGSFAGTIEHTGSVFFNADTVEVGNFTIAFDAARAGTLGGNASGFYVASTVGVVAPLFDIQVTGASPELTSLTVDGDLLVSPELGGFLLTNQLATSNLAGVAVGAARVEAVAIPEPSTLAIVGLAACGLIAYRRRSK